MGLMEKSTGGKKMLEKCFPLVRFGSHPGTEVSTQFYLFLTDKSVQKYVYLKCLEGSTQFRGAAEEACAARAGCCRRVFSHSRFEHALTAASYAHDIWPTRPLNDPDGVY